MKHLLPPLAAFILVLPAFGCAKVEDSPPDTRVEVPPDGELVLEEQQREQCNNVDDDGNGKVDDGIGDHGELIQSCSTECGDGWQSCFSGEWWPCSAPEPRSDGTCPCEDGDEKRCETLCGVGVQVCNANMWGACSAGTGGEEICDNGIDDDCDDQIDEGECGCQNGTQKECGETKGECKAGTQRCFGGEWGDCLGLIEPKTETCNGKDDDCDAVTDNNVEGDRYEENDTCEWAARIPNAPEGGTENAIEGNLAEGDDDWFVVLAEEGSHWCVPFTSQCCFELTATVSVEEGTLPQLCLREGGCGGGPTCTSGGQASATVSFSGTCGSSDSRDIYIQVLPPGGQANCHTYTVRYRFTYSG